jgi:hypothetical protein
MVGKEPLHDEKAVSFLEAHSVSPFVSEGSWGVHVTAQQVLYTARID